MSLTKKSPLVLLAILSFCAFAFGLPASGVNLPVSPNFAFDDDEDEDNPDVKNRVARVSFLEGEAKVRRNGSDDWEKISLNLPLVEGDEVATEEISRIEIQFDKNRHLRLDENSFLKLTTLKDEGIAISLSAGHASLLATAFDKSRSFFEIDAPKVTIALQKAGRYAIDAGEQGDREVRLTVEEDGEARVYSENAGFTLKNGRTARVFTDGPNAGEWETSAAFSSNDPFGSWVADREASVANKLRTAHYDKYYDQDMYGADDLGDNGDWINTTDYGYVWRPSRLATAQYFNWSPYRYGHWRFMAPYGWIWVNDEPWGWATYHYGRWFNYNGGWVWSPYGYYRPRRSWWSPALIVINIYNNNACWYPLGYHRRRRNFNAHYQRKGREKIIRDGGPVRNPPLPGKTPKSREIPLDGIVTADINEFGKRGMRVKTVPDAVAKTIFADEKGGVTGVILPEPKDRRIISDTLTHKPRTDPMVQTRLGAGPKRTDGSLDAELEKTRIFGGRTPQKRPENNSTETIVRPTEPRKTGAVDRSEIVRQPSDPVKQPPRDADPVRQPRTRETPVYSPPTRDEKPSNSTPKQTPRYDPPPKPVEKPRSDPSAPTKQSPRSDPPPTKSDPGTSPSRKEKPDSL